MILATAGSAFGQGAAKLVYEVTSPYHHIRVIDSGDLRTLCFDDAMESRMSLTDPAKGHFEYTEYFHMAWLWNVNITNVLMIGLGGASAQRSFALYHPGVIIKTAELDPAVGRVSREYFNLVESDAQRVVIEDGRVYLRRNTTRQDLIVLDAYVSGRYGSSIPQHLATREFFELVRDRLTTNGVVAYNVIGTTSAWHANLIGAMYKTMKTVFPYVYIFRAQSSLNMVLIGTRLGPRADMPILRQRAAFLVQSGRVTLPGYAQLIDNFVYQEPASVMNSPILTDDYAPIEGLSAAGGNPEAPSAPRTNAPPRN